MTPSAAAARRGAIPVLGHSNDKITFVKISPLWCARQVGLGLSNWWACKGFERENWKTEG